MSLIKKVPTIQSLTEERNTKINNFLSKTFTEDENENIPNTQRQDRITALKYTLDHIIQTAWKDREEDHKEHFNKNYVTFLRNVWLSRDPEVLKQMYSIFIAVKEKKELTQDQIDLLFSFKLKNRESVLFINKDIRCPHGDISWMWFNRIFDSTIKQYFKHNHIGHLSDVIFKEKVENNSFWAVWDSLFEDRFMDNNIDIACCRNTFNHFLSNRLSWPIWSIVDNVFIWHCYSNVFKESAEDIWRKNDFTKAVMLDDFNQILTFEWFKQQNFFNC